MKYDVLSVVPNKRPIHKSCWWLFFVVSSRPHPNQPAIIQRPSIYESIYGYASHTPRSHSHGTHAVWLMVFNTRNFNMLRWVWNEYSIDGVSWMERPHTCVCICLHRQQGVGEVLLSCLVGWSVGPSIGQMMEEICLDILQLQIVITH